MTIAVIIPASNAAATIGETLDSVLAQSTRPESVIVVDDGSIDATAAIARAHPVVTRVISTENRGASAAVNTGAKAAESAWLTFLDSDDTWTPQWIAVGTAACLASGADAVMAMSQAFVDPGLTAADLAGLRFVERPLPGAAGAFMVKRDVFQALGGFDEGYRTGYFIDFFHRFRHAGYEAHSIADCVLRRRIRAHSNGRRQAARIGQANDRLSSDFLRIAHAAIQRRQTGAKNER